jgi:hypothetical protein
MNRPLRIRAEDGETIDLADMRAYYVERAWTTEIALLDALEAALGVPLDEHGINGHNTALLKVRYAAGVIEENGA